MTHRRPCLSLRSCWLPSVLSRHKYRREDHEVLHAHNDQVAYVGRLRKGDTSASEQTTGKGVAPWGCWVESQVVAVTTLYCMTVFGSGVQYASVLQHLLEQTQRVFTVTGNVSMTELVYKSPSYMDETLVINLTQHTTWRRHIYFQTVQGITGRYFHYTHHVTVSSYPTRFGVLAHSNRFISLSMKLLSVRYVWLRFRTWFEVNVAAVYVFTLSW